MFDFLFRIVNSNQIHSPCGNSTGAQTCPNGGVCLPGNLSLVNDGFTNFDTISASFFVVVRLLQRDYWEEILHYLTATVGPWSIFLFIAIIYYGSFQLCALLWTPIALAYNYMKTELWESDLMNDLKEVCTSTMWIEFPLNLVYVVLKTKQRNKSANSE